VAAALAACADQPTAPPDITVQVMEPVVWADGDWILRSPGFGALPSLPTITLDASGQVLSDVPTPAGSTASMVLDPRGRWIYLTRYADPTVTVLDRQSLGLVATLQATGACSASTYYCGQVGTGIDAAQRRLHALHTYYWGFGGTEVPTNGVPSPIFDFSLPPVTQTPLTLAP